MWSKLENETGCPRCGLALYDRLTRVWKGVPCVQPEFHLNSGPDLDALRKLRATEHGGRDVYVRDKAIVAE